MSGENRALKDEFVAQSAAISVPAPKPTIKKLNFSHEAIIRWMLENPEKSLGDCAAHFNYTRSWLSIIVHSDAFQAKLRMLQEEADALVVADIPSQLRGTASIAIEALSAQVELAAKDQTPAPRDFLLKSSEMLLKSLGYGAGNTRISVSAPNGNVQVNHGVNADALSRARARITSPRTNEEKEVPAISGPETPTA